MLIKNISDFRKAVRLGPYAWPGGYPLCWIMSDGEIVSFNVAKTERRAFLEALHPDNPHDSSGWRPIAIDVNWEGEYYCAHTGTLIERAYEINLTQECNP